MHRSDQRAVGPARRSLAVRSSSYLWKATLVLGVAVGGLWTATHGVAGVAWHDVLLVLRAVTLWHLVLLTAVWLGGLAIYSVVLSAALPGVGMRRSLLLNLSGSAVANVLPLGGAVATALNWRMVRRWGHSNNSFVTFCVLTNALDVATKLFLPVVGIATLATLSEHVPRVLWLVAVTCALVLLCVLLAQAVLLRPAAEGAPEDPRRHAALLRQGRESSLRIRSLFLAQWGRLLPGSVGYIAAQVALLVISLRSVGLDAPLSVVLMAAAIERLGTLVPLTPGGTGIAEIGTIAWLVATGLDPASVVAGVLLYRIFLVAMEIPVGGVLLGAWAWLQRATEAREADKVPA